MRQQSPAPNAGHSPQGYGGCVMVQDDGTRFAAAVALDGDPPSSLLRGVQVTTNATVGVLHSGSDQTHPRLRRMAVWLLIWWVGFPSNAVSTFLSHP